MNRVPSKNVPKTPYQLWTGDKPKFKHVRIWGCPLHIMLPPQERHKQQAKMKKKHSFVGYPLHSKILYV